MAEASGRPSYRRGRAPYESGKAFYIRRDARDRRNSRSSALRGRKLGRARLTDSSRFPVLAISRFSWKRTRRSTRRSARAGGSPPPPPPPTREELTRRLAVSQSVSRTFAIRYAWRAAAQLVVGKSVPAAPCQSDANRRNTARWNKWRERYGRGRPRE